MHECRQTVEHVGSDTAAQRRGEAPPEGAQPAAHNHARPGPPFVVAAALLTDHIKELGSPSPRTPPPPPAAAVSGVGRWRTTGPDSAPMLTLLRAPSRPRLGTLPLLAELRRSSASDGALPNASPVTASAPSSGQALRIESARDGRRRAGDAGDAVGGAAAGDIGEGGVDMRPGCPTARQTATGQKRGRGSCRWYICRAAAAGGELLLLVWPGFVCPGLSCRAIPAWLGKEAWEATSQVTAVSRSDGVSDLALLITSQQQSVIVVGDVSLLHICT